MKISLTIFIFFAFLCSCNSNNQSKKPTPKDLSTVFICTGLNATAYHASEQCPGLANCSGEIKRVGIDVVKVSRNPCSKCFEVDTDSTTSNISEPIKKKYIYLDCQNVLHYTLECEVLNPFQENHREEYAISFIEFDNLDSQPHWYCSRCFTDRRFEELSKRVRHLPDTHNYTE